MNISIIQAPLPHVHVVIYMTVFSLSLPQMILPRKNGPAGSDAGPCVPVGGGPSA